MDEHKEKMGARQASDNHQMMEQRMDMMQQMMGQMMGRMMMLQKAQKPARLHDHRGTMR